MKPCDRCGSASITYYKQQRKDGVWVVTARCENWHHPITGKPFYPISQFDIAALPVLGETPSPQPVLFDIPPQPKEPKPERDLLEFVAEKRRAANRFTWRKA